MCGCPGSALANSGSRKGQAAGDGLLLDVLLFEDDFEDVEDEPDVEDDDPDDEPDVEAGDDVEESPDDDPEPPDLAAPTVLLDDERLSVR
jgi:hypothetical protein